MRRNLAFLAFALFIAALLYGWNTYRKVYKANVPSELKSDLIQIPSNTSFNEVTRLLHSNEILLDTNSFIWLSGKMNYNKPIVRSGQFKIPAGASNLELIRLLRSGKQEPQKVIINNERFIADIISNVCKQLEPDSISLMNLSRDTAFLSELGYNQDNLISMFIPNTYEFFWNTKPEDFFLRMKKESEKFWDKKGRIDKALELGLTEMEVYTLASIIQKETNAAVELPIIAGLYINRLNKNMLLQADPTVVYANGEFELRRVLNKHLAYDSPYNTYLYKGLPPGPISVASIASIDAVLNRTEHNYIFFCAKPDNSGLHAFAKTLAGHNANARKFHNWLNKRGIR